MRPGSTLGLPPFRPLALAERSPSRVRSAIVSRSNCAMALIRVNKSFPVDVLVSYERLLGFLDWLQSERKSGIATRNQRQAAINSFIRFLMYEKPEFLNEYQKILGIPVKKVPQKEISYLKTDGVSALMEQVDTRKADGLRDLGEVFCQHPQDKEKAIYSVWNDDIGEYSMGISAACTAQP